MSEIPNAGETAPDCFGRMFPASPLTNYGERIKLNECSSGKF